MENILIVSQGGLYKSPQNPSGNLDGGKMQEILCRGGSERNGPKHNIPRLFGRRFLC